MHVIEGCLILPCFTQCSHTLPLPGTCKAGDGNVAAGTDKCLFTEFRKLPTGEDELIKSDRSGGADTEEQKSMRLAKSRATCARLCTEDYLGTDIALAPNTYILRNSHLLPANSAGCDGKLILVILDQKTHPSYVPFLKPGEIIVHRATMSAQNNEAGMDGLGGTRL